MDFQEIDLRYNEIPKVTCLMEIGKPVRYFLSAVEVEPRTDDENLGQLHVRDIGEVDGGIVKTLRDTHEKMLKSQVWLDAAGDKAQIITVFYSGNGDILDSAQNVVESNKALAGIDEQIKFMHINTHLDEFIDYMKTDSRSIPVFINNKQSISDALEGMQRNVQNLTR